MTENEKKLKELQLLIRELKLTPGRYGHLILHFRDNKIIRCEKTESIVFSK